MSKTTAVNRRGGGGGVVTRRRGRRSGRAGSPEPPEGVADRGRARRGEELRADPCGEGQAVRVPREMLLQLDERRAGLEVGLDQPSVAVDDLRFLGAGHRPGGEDPGGAEGAAADHDRGAAGRADHGARVVVAPHVAVSGDRDRDGVDDRGDDLPGGEAGELLRARARATVWPLPWTRARASISSLVRRPAPHSRATSRNGALVTAAMGARRRSSGLTRPSVAPVAHPSPPRYILRRPRRGL